MRGCRRGDDDRVDAPAGQHSGDVVAGGNGRVPSPHVRQAIGTAVADDRQLDPGQVVEDACVVGPPVSESDERKA